MPFKPKVHQPSRVAAKKAFSGDESNLEHREEIFSYAAYRVQLAGFARTWADQHRKREQAWKTERKLKLAGV